MYYYACREECQEPFEACISRLNVGQCADVYIDAYNCGGCSYDGSGKKCGENIACVNGVCQLSCVGNSEVCGDSCIDPTTDNKNCGGCVADGRGKICEQGQRCSEGICGATCGGSTIPCGDSCIDPSKNIHNCGGCVEEGKGEKCETGYDCIEGECKAVCSQECLNGGVCSAPDTCQCASGWEGHNCSTAICVNPCVHGSCVTPNKCSCETGWTGSDCSVAICYPTCQNGGSCVAPNVCSCTSEWTGNVCSEPICSPACQNGGSCVAPNVCSRTSEWTGNDCSEPICNPACQNGGSCVAVNVCSCPLTWVGPDCGTQDRVRIPVRGDETSFSMGRSLLDDVGGQNEEPPHGVVLAAYEIDRYPVTAAAYKLCVDAGVCRILGEYSTYNKVGLELHPINSVTWADAVKYCEWAKGRLPTEAEWERAARGSGSRRFPWGSECPTNAKGLCDRVEWTESTARANCGENDCHDGYVKTSPVNAFPRGVSPEGVWDMVGNVFEWTSDYAFREYQNTTVTNPKGPDSGSEHVMRGGCYSCGANQLVSSVRESYFTEMGEYEIGFRCARSLP